MPLPTVFADVAETGCNATLGGDGMAACRKHLCDARVVARLDGTCVARKPAPPALTTTTSNVWSMNLYAGVNSRCPSTHQDFMPTTRGDISLRLDVLNIIY
jgi:hypothetical protein